MFVSPLTLKAVRASVLVSFAISIGSLAAAADIPQRKNVDDLTETELNNFIAAVAILKERTSQYGDKALDPATNKDAPCYAYLAMLHNGPPDGAAGPYCVHGKPRFLVWHRAVLYYYEKALQHTKPEYADVTLPYWDWTTTPSGRRYAKAFEAPTLANGQPNPLYDPRRDHSPCTSGSTASCASTSLPSGIPSSCPAFCFQYIYRDVLKDSTWAQFAGESTTLPMALEQPHNTMHVWIGGYNPNTGEVGDMTNLTTAAKDPLFWSFHCFVDQLFYYWQTLNPNADYSFGSTSQQEFFAEGISWANNPTPWWTVPGGAEKNLTLVGQFMNVSDLGFTYALTPNESNPPTAPLAIDAFAAVAPGVAAMAVNAEPEAIHNFEFKVPKPGYGQAVLSFSELGVPMGFGYFAHVYMHPASIKYVQGDASFKKYQVTTFTMLNPVHHHQHEKHPLRVTVTRELSRVSKSSPGEPYAVTVAMDIFGKVSADQIKQGTSLGKFKLELAKKSATKK